MIKCCVCVLGLKSPISSVLNLNNNIRWRFELRESAINEVERKFNLYCLNVLVSFIGFSLY